MLLHPYNAFTFIQEAEVKRAADSNNLECKISNLPTYGNVLLQQPLFWWCVACNHGNLVHLAGTETNSFAQELTLKSVHII